MGARSGWGPKSALDQHGLAAPRGCLAGDIGGAARVLRGGLRCGPDEEGWSVLLVSWPGSMQFLFRL
ncbi:hypothetical protein NDU88_003388 [Pleurodeles waltl]|uniref:Uncharacterized protein n=1 Tax=Pleurodeles waltl TaxID=8319 RepID=A0AAV7KXB3_PLEWA|nr:hypothetical protein NDU88_003388 [Pleurodeles waltl]